MLYLVWREVSWLICYLFTSCKLLYGYIVYISVQQHVLWLVLNSIIYCRCSFLCVPHFTCPQNAPVDECVLAAMRWGLVPSWFKEENPNKMQYSTNNCRSENIMEKKSYKVHTVWVAMYSFSSFVFGAELPGVSLLALFCPSRFHL